MPCCLVYCRSMPTVPIPPRNYSTGSSAPFQLNSKPNSSPQRTLESCKSKKASHPGWEIMLLGSMVDTFDAGLTNWPWPGEGCAQFKTGHVLCLLHGPIGRFLHRPPTGALLWQANQKFPYGTMEQSTWPVLNCALPFPGQGQFVSPAIR